MPSKNQTVVKINKSTLELVRIFSTEFNTSVPKMLDLMAEAYKLTYKSVIADWDGDLSFGMDKAHED